MKTRTIRSIFFSTFALIALITVVGICTMYSVLQAPKIKAQTVAALTQSTQSISAAMDTELSRMSTVAMNIAYSTQVSDSFADVSSYSPVEEARRTQSLLTMQLFPGRPIDQIDLYTMNGAVISTGLRTEIHEGSAEDAPWFPLITSSDKNQVHLFTGQDANISKFYTDEYGKHFVSFAMRIYNTFNLPYGYVEIRQRLNRIVGAAMDYKSIYGEQVFVFDLNGQQMFPLNNDSSTLFQAAQTLDFPEAFSRYDGSSDSNRLICAQCTNGGFHVIMTISNRALNQPVRSFLMNTFLVAALALLFVLLISYYSARIITVPLNTFCQQLKEMDSPQSTSLHPESTNIEEIQTLYLVFSQLQTTLQESIRTQILLEEQEMQSRMLALQTQMNPHLLYNSLATIQAMSDEGMTDEISSMCQSISSILRYIASDTEREVSLSTEMRYVRDYVQCMSFRYQEDLTCSIALPEEMAELRVPKLCVQLLVENAIKYAALKRPPYCICIDGRLSDSAYEITIRDNGPGFSEDTLRALRAKIENINQTGCLPALEINGMGILNVYIRFRLLHGENTIFRLENQEVGGASITMGAKING